ncbi:transcription elongation factor A protein 3-like isoform X2 [Ambystoma mexicanum]|uniref:transcription elongation factor A protein 3-like isoform X2 n=1 Tax=Ambystoma mexicanum TaxID=8296 RepID=UPI0037E7DD0E
MGQHEELLTIAKKLDKMITQKNLDGALDLLRELSRQQMTVELLQATRLGVMVNGLRKHCSDQGVMDLAKMLIKDWKRLLDSQRPKHDAHKGKKDQEKEKRLGSSCRIGAEEPIQLCKSAADMLKGQDRSVSDRKALKLEPVPKKHVKDSKPERSVSDRKALKLEPVPKKHVKDSKPERNLPIACSQPTMPTAGPKNPPTDPRLERIPTITSPKPISHSTAPKAPLLDPRLERYPSLASPKAISHAAAPKALVLDPRLERNPSVTPKKPSSHPAAAKTLPVDPKLESPSTKASGEAKSTSSPAAPLPLKRPSTERRPSTSSNPAASPPTFHKISTDGRDERRQSAGSNPAASPPGSRKNSSDGKEERRQSTGSNPAASPPGSRKNSSDGKEERRPPISSISMGSPSNSQKKSVESKEDRRLPINSIPMGSPPNSQKKSVESKEDRSNGNRTKPETPKTPTSPSDNCALNPLFRTGNSVRDKCVEMITAALKFEDDYKQFGTNCEKKASEMEDFIYKDVKATDMKYRNRVRSRISNLKDPKNPNLRRNVLCGAISPERIATMTSEEMASDELKELRSSLTQEAIREHQMAKTGGTQTDFLQCGKCKKKNCSYNQVQTRSADEPMTTFVLCNECGNRWKFC